MSCVRNIVIRQRVKFHHFHLSDFLNCKESRPAQHTTLGRRLSNRWNLSISYIWAWRLFLTLKCFTFSPRLYKLGLLLFASLGLFYDQVEYEKEWNRAEQLRRDVNEERKKSKKLSFYSNLTYTFFFDLSQKNKCIKVHAGWREIAEIKLKKSAQRFTLIFTAWIFIWRGWMDFFDKIVKTIHTSQVFFSWILFIFLVKLTYDKVCFSQALTSEDHRVCHRREVERKIDEFFYVW